MSDQAAVRAAPGGARLDALADRLGGLTDRLARDLLGLEEELALLFRAPAPDPARAAARHLLEGGGKRVRPFLCLLAARGGRRPGERGAAAAAPLARAAELLHGATLLHDDVVDEGDLRRGRPAARVVHGNAGAVIGGDLLLVEALELVRAQGDDALLDAFLGVLREMVDAEAVQLARRGRVDADLEAWDAVARGKTASLFGWACEAGGRVAGHGAREVEALRAFGRELGMAFQLVDDLLDLDGEPERTGKTALSDLAQGTLGHVACLAVQRDPDLAVRLGAAAAGAPDAALGAALRASALRTGALRESRSAARRRTARAARELDVLPGGDARDGLRAVADELAERIR